MKPKFYAIVKNQKLVFPDRGLSLYYGHLKSLEGKEVEITIGRRKKSRSGQQNRFWWGVVVRILADELGYEDDDIHYELRRKFLSQPGEKLDIPKSTTELSTVEFNDLVERVQRWASTYLNIVIPDPQ